MNYIKKSIFVLVLLLLFFPFIQGIFYLVKPIPLDGYYVPNREPEITISSWFNGTYQDSCITFIKESSSLRSVLVRMYNQVDYSLFSVPHARKIVIGKNDYLYSDEYITAYLGTNFSGKQFCDEKVRLLKKLQDLLWNEKKIFLLTILTPDKCTFYPENIPERYLKHKNENTNYGYYAEKCKEAGINLIDFNQAFLRLKKTTPYSLYPKTGIHWSTYGSIVAADSMLKYLEVKLNVKFPKIVIDSIQISSVALDVDDDIEATLNLLFRLPHSVYGYPRYHFITDTTTKKLNALFVGDSFYWNWYPQIIRGIFNNDDFWYYNMEIFPKPKTKKVIVSQINIADVINKENIIILMQVNGAKGNIGYGFIDEALSVLDTSKSEELKKTEDVIRGNNKWMIMIQEKAKKNHLTVEEQLKLDALYMIDLQQKGKK
jgi:hypothetical protein